MLEKKECSSVCGQATAVTFIAGLELIGPPSFKGSSGQRDRFRSLLGYFTLQESESGISALRQPMTSQPWTKWGLVFQFIFKL